MVRFLIALLLNEGYTLGADGVRSMPRFPAKSCHRIMNSLPAPSERSSRALVPYIDFNWGEGGPDDFAKPGLWAYANPGKHANWYADFGCNVIQSFAVSCNGYAWYKNGIVPEQPGLKYDFLTEQVKLATKKTYNLFIADDYLTVN